MVTERQAMFVVIVGLIVTMLGVGGVENSVTNTELLQSLAVSVTGLACMYCGTVMIRRAEQ